MNKDLYKIVNQEFNNPAKKRQLIDDEVNRRKKKLDTEEKDARYRNNQIHLIVNRKLTDENLKSSYNEEIKDLKDKFEKKINVIKKNISQCNEKINNLYDQISNKEISIEVLINSNKIAQHQIHLESLNEQLLCIQKELDTEINNYYEKEKEYSRKYIEYEKELNKTHILTSCPWGYDHDCDDGCVL